MTFEEFFKIVCEVYDDQYAFTYHETIKEFRWIVGGATGYGWDGGGSNQVLEPENEPEFDLDKLFERVCSNKSYLQFRAIITKQCIVYGDDKNDGYYGDYTVYKVKIIDYRNIYKFLVKFGLIQSS